jgi:signal transduction histidine kinase
VDDHPPGPVGRAAGVHEPHAQCHWGHEETGGVLTVKTQLGEDGQLLVSVSDTGVGLPKEQSEQIFDAFFTTKPQGSGMGLSISRSIVESHGRRLWATANNGRGATFHFTLPTAAEVVRVPDTGM